MRVGLSVYSLEKEYQKGLGLEESFKWAKESGADYIEFVSFVTDFKEKPELIAEVKAMAAKYDLDIETYCTPGDVCDKSDEEYEAEIQSLKDHIDIAAKLGVKVVRHDLSSFRRERDKCSIEYFDKDLPKIVEACQRLSDHAKQYGITVTVENHGFYINGGDRVRRLMLAVDRDNFGCTLDIGNSLCVDEDPLVCVETLLPYAVAVHFKDFFVRKDNKFLGDDEEYWFISNRNRYLRGTIIGQGEIDVETIAKRIKDYGYDGTVTVEFEGLEDSFISSKTGMENVKKLFDL